MYTNHLPAHKQTRTNAQVDWVYVPANLNDIVIEEGYDPQIAWHSDDLHAIVDRGAQWTLVDAHREADAQSRIPFIVRILAAIVAIFS